MQLGEAELFFVQDGMQAALCRSQGSAGMGVRTPTLDCSSRWPPGSLLVTMPCYVSSGVWSTPPAPSGLK